MQSCLAAIVCESPAGVKLYDAAGSAGFDDLMIRARQLLHKLET